jgi:arylsulfatase A-like enzyme
MPLRKICKLFKITAFLLALLIIFSLPPTLLAAKTQKPNILFIAVDDLNDWIASLKGHPQIKTPNIDRLAKRGILFTNAHCVAPACNPSRAAVFSGMQPMQTGVYSNSSDRIRKAQPDLALLPQYFASQGYHTLGTGKLLHSNSSGLFHDEFFTEQKWSPFDKNQVNYTSDDVHTKGTSNPRHEIKNGPGGKTYILPFNRMPSDRAPDELKAESFDWGPVDVADSDMGDGKITDWSIDRLANLPDKPFFMAVGYYRPHIPLYAPSQHFDKYPKELDIILPKVKANDLDDLSPIAKKWAIEAVTAGSHKTVLEYDQWHAAVRAYMACVTFVDTQIGRLLDTLDNSPYADNTTIILWGDHGWHLGEKQHWGKWTGWRRSTKVPLIIVPPKSAKENFQSNVQCSEPVSLLDLYPTLIDLTASQSKPELKGTSLVPLLKNPKEKTNRYALTIFDKANYSLTGTKYHYIRYNDGSEELYNFKNDPYEWENLASKPEHQKQIKKMKKHLPISD